MQLNDFSNSFKFNNRSISYFRCSVLLSVLDKTAYPTPNEMHRYHSVRITYSTPISVWMYGCVKIVHAHWCFNLCIRFLLIKKRRKRRDIGKSKTTMGHFTWAKTNTYILIFFCIPWSCICFINLFATRTHKLSTTTNIIASMVFVRIFCWCTGAQYIKSNFGKQTNFQTQTIPSWKSVPLLQ